MSQWVKALAARLDYQRTVTDRLQKTTDILRLHKHVLEVLQKHTYIHTNTHTYTNTQQQGDERGARGRCRKKERWGMGIVSVHRREGTIKRRRRGDGRESGR